MVIKRKVDWAPPTCTLPTAERPVRVAEFDALFASARWYRRPLRTHLDLAIPPEAERTGRVLAGRESSCCSFFTFAFEQLGTDLMMHIGVPAGHVAVLDALQQRIAAAMGGPR
jgi:hypothetical protein